MRTVTALVILLQVCLAAVAADPASQTPPVLALFDGKSFAGWEGNLQAFRVEDGKRFVMFLKDETRQPPAKNLRVATAEAPAGPYGPPSAPITGKYWAEGPSVIKLGDKWFVYFDRYTEHRYGLVTSKDLVHWDEESDKVRFPVGHRHGSVLQVNREVLKGLLEP